SPVSSQPDALLCWLCARFASARAELRGADPLALPIPGVQSAGTAPLGAPWEDCFTVSELLARASRSARKATQVSGALTRERRSRSQFAVAGAAAFLPLAVPLPLALPWALLPLPLPFDLALEEPRTASRSSAA